MLSAFWEYLNLSVIVNWTAFFAFCNVKYYSVKNTEIASICMTKNEMDEYLVTI